ncbi:bifunctional phosphopantothenoylcysteine decarboxylase/phosphopantothenate--cysteine ligase CoaBC [Candidatus Sumerlaeota bacterium]|nr:bifunctional phosphopantothenoylcysteine decarboxylase/phosphopantothenate--cysteine ligase CoaBC [Candidatus Sumerlaeota bacterium]
MSIQMLPVSGSDGPMLPGVKVLLGVSSSIAAHRALDLASLLRKAGAEVRAVLTEAVPHLIGPAAFDAITHQRTITSLWGSGHEGEMDHLAVTKWADVFVVCPATANVIAELAHGIAHDALGTFAVAWNKRPLLIAPAMNPEMYRNSAVQANLGALAERGHEIIEPVVGPTACDDVGRGRLAPVELIFDRIVDQIRRGQTLSGKTILITSGPTREFADDVRCITNPSTGKQGVAIAQEAMARGARVVFVTGPVSIPLPKGLHKIRRVTSADEMLAAVLEEQPAIDIAVFAAAVSDWKPADRMHGKEKKTSKDGEVEMKLVRTPDIAATANRRRTEGQVFIGFAAESTNLESYAGEKMRGKGFSLVFANPINESGAGFGSDTNRGLILRHDGTRREVATASKSEIARILLDELEGFMEMRDAAPDSSIHYFI